MYDTLTVPTNDADMYAPYLAKTVTPNADYDEWTIGLRAGITFQDGTPLNAAAVKQNIDAWRKGVLLGFVFQNIAEHRDAGRHDRRRHDEGPVGRVPGVPVDHRPDRHRRAGAARTTTATCDTNMIGTGPFKLDDFDPTTGDVRVVEEHRTTGARASPTSTASTSRSRRTATSGSAVSRVASSTSSTTTAATTSNDRGLRQWHHDLSRRARPPEISQTLLNVTRPPLDDLNIRKALAMAVDRDTLNQIANKGKSDIVEPGLRHRRHGLRRRPGLPEVRTSTRPRSSSRWKSDNGGKSDFNLQSTFDQSTQALAKEVKRQLGEVGINVNLPAPVDQATIINQAIGSQVDAFRWRNYPGQDPDTMYVWFYGGSVVNFNHVDDAAMNEALDKGRSEPDPADAQGVLRDLQQAALVAGRTRSGPGTRTWFIAHKSNVKGIVGPNLPDENGAAGTEKPVPILAGYHQLARPLEVEVATLDGARVQPDDASRTSERRVSASFAVKVSGSSSSCSSSRSSPSG